MEHELGGSEHRAKGVDGDGEDGNRETGQHSLVGDTGKYVHVGKYRMLNMQKIVSPVHPP